MSYFLELTPRSLFWTGDFRGRGNALMLTGLKGALRWWYETLVRGIGKGACDPTEGGCLLEFTNEERLEFQRADRDRRIAMVKARICPACYLFGTTGWQGRFRLEHVKVTVNGEESLTDRLNKGIPVRVHIGERWQAPLEPVELRLLSVLFSFITDHGSLCGRGGRKPSEQDTNKPADPDHKNRDGYKNHTNYGLCSTALRREGAGGAMVDPDPGLAVIDATKIAAYLAPFRTVVPPHDSKWPDFRYVWYANVLLERLQINAMVQRDPANPKRYLPTATDDDKWVGGSIGKNGVCKKIFAFHTTDAVRLPGPRVWGYCPPNSAGKTWITSRWPATVPSLCWGEDFLKREGVLR